MERFTYKHDDEWCINGVNGKVNSDNQANYWGEAIDRLAEYENFIEEERLVILPCKIGTRTYKIVPDLSVEWPDPPKYKIIWDTFHIRDIYDFGEKTFLSYKEAEENLIKYNNMRRNNGKIY